jgi:hypothetical protein
MSLDGSTWGSIDYHKRDFVKVQAKSRRKCGCCNRRATHIGTANGIAFVKGCEMSIRRWVRAGKGTH